MYKPLLTCIFLLSGIIAFAQTPDSSLVIDNSLSGQYKEILKKSNSMQNYKVVRMDRLSGIYKSFMDTLRKERIQLSNAKTKLEEQSKTIALLNNDVNKKEKNLQEATSQVDEISLLGIPVQKNTYRLIMWGLIFVLGATLAFIIFQSAGYRKEAKYRIKLFEDLSEEFQSYKVKSIEKEKKLARELQTERNHLEELKQR